MPPQNTPNQTPEIPQPSSEETETTIPASENKPESAPEPISSELPRTENFQDQSTIAQPSQPVDSAIEPEPAETVEVPAETETAYQEEVERKGDISEAWVDATKTIIEKDEDKPYEEEEDAEKLNIDYQQKTFGKKITKEDD